MLNAKDILYSVRAFLKDNNEITYSDYDITIALNNALRYISQSSLLKDTDFLETSKEFSQEDTTLGVALPDDFQSLTGVTADDFTLAPVRVTKTPKEYQYKIMGSKIFCGAPKFTLTYKKMLYDIAEITKDTIDLPKFCMNLVVQITISILKGAETNAIITQMNEIIATDIPVKKYNGKAASVVEQ